MIVAIGEAIRNSEWQAQSAAGADHAVLIVCFAGAWTVLGSLGVIAALNRESMRDRHLS